MLKINCIGNLGFDAKIVEGNFEKFVSFNVAHHHNYTDRNGVVVEEVVWVNCVINWKCERLLPYLKKGTKVFVSGSMKTRIYQDRENKNRVGIDCVVSEIELCGTPSVSTTGQGETEENKNKQSLNSENPFESVENNNEQLF